MKKQPFEYQPLEKLTEARRQLAAIKDRNQAESAGRAAAMQQVADARETLLLLQTKQALGEATASELQRAAGALQEAETRLADLEKMKQTGAASIAYLLEAIERLEKEEEAANMAIFKPQYQAALANFDAALEAAKKAGEELLAIQNQGGVLAAGWPSSWLDVFHAQECRLYWWRESAKQHGLL